MNPSRLRRPSPTLKKRGRADKPGPRLRAVPGGLFLVLLATVVWGSLVPAPPSAPGGFNDKVQHFVGYGSLALLAQLALPGRRLRAAVGVILLGFAVEVAQELMALGREASWLDALANTAGVLLATALLTLLGPALVRLRGETRHH